MPPSLKAIPLVFKRAEHLAKISLIFCYQMIVSIKIAPETRLFLLGHKGNYKCLTTTAKGATSLMRE